MRDGVEEYGRGGGLVQAKTPGCHDVITFDEHAPDGGESRGIVHFGFRLVSAGDIDAAVDEVERRPLYCRYLAPNGVYTLPRLA